MSIGRFATVLLIVSIQQSYAQSLLDDGNTGIIRWDNWSSWSACSTDCGKGVSTRSRDCRSTVTGDVVTACVGDDEEIKVCEETGCLREVTTHKECRKLQSRMYGGKRYRWEPYLHPSKPCQLACRPMGAGFYLGLDMHVPDGSLCEKGSPNICVQGVCKSVGCDGVVGSMAVQDHCGVCSGDGTSCKQVVRTFAEPLKFGYHTLTTIPSGATNIMITETIKSRNYLAIKATDRTFQLNTMFRLSRFGDHPGGGTLFTYNRGTGPDCPDECITADGPINVPIEVQTLVYEETISIKVTFNIKTTMQEYSEIDELTSPLVEIEAGVIRKGTDEQVPDVRNQPIFSHDFKFKKKRKHHKHGKTSFGKGFVGKTEYDEKYFANVANDGDITRGTGQLSNKVNKKVGIDKYSTDKTSATNRNEILNNTIIDTNINNNNITIQDNIPGVETKFDKTVNTGTSALQGVTAKPGVGQGNEEVDNANGNVEEEETAVGEEEEDGMEAEAEEEEGEEEDSESESESDSDDEESEDDNDEDSSSSESTSVDEDIENESANTTEDNTVNDATTTGASPPVEDEANEIIATNVGNGSLTLEPEEEDDDIDMYNNDNTIPSLYSWSLTGYTACSKTCGRGTQDPILRCIVTDKQAAVADTFCANLLKPEKTPKACGTGDCPPSWKPGTWSKCSVTCDIGVQIRDFICVLDDGQQVSNWRCGSGAPRREEKTCDMGSCSSGWYYTGWDTGCSAVCGYGTVERHVTCISGTGNKYTACPPRERPDSEKSCRNDDCGGFWLTGPWSKCNATCGEAYQTRAVTCAQKHRDRITVVSEYGCKEEEKPATYMTCDVPPCGAEWYMNAWGECSVTCGSGQRSRDVRCMSPDHVQSSSCDPRSKPVEREACIMRACPAADQAPSPPVTRRPKKPKVTPATDPHCKDRFDQCRLVLQARLCSYQYYRKVCCKSCANQRR